MRYPPHTLASYAFIGDGERGGLIGPAGDIAWMSAPTWHSDPIFDSLIGGRGLYAVTPASTFTWGGYYEPDGLIWRNRWVTAAGVIECRDTLAWPPDPHRAVVLRQVASPEVPQEVSIEVCPSYAFGTTAMTRVDETDSIWTARLGPLHLRWRGPTSCRRRRGSRNLPTGLCSQVAVEPGRPLDLVLEVSDRPLMDDPPAPDYLWSETVEEWARGVPALDSVLDRKGCRFDYAVMRGLTSKSGGMVAAATTSLPERAAQGRNYDYRYVWIRDQAYAGQAAASAGVSDLLESALGFITARVHEHGPELAPAYTVDGRPVPGPRQVDLPGYPGGFDIVGNRVHKQFQLDTFGEALLVFAAGLDADVANAETIRAAHIAADAIEDRWKDPDAGVWEVEDRLWTHSRLMCVAGLRRMAQAIGPADPAAAGRWSAQADYIASDTANRSVHQSGRWQRHPDDPAVDAALLLPPLRGAFPRDDPRTGATLKAVLSDLTENGYAYRFRHGQQPLGRAEGSFVLCGFIVAMALHDQGRTAEAARWFERHNHCAGPPGIYAEEWDTTERQLRGNLPQAFVHAMHLQAAAHLYPEQGPDKHTEEGHA